MANALAVVRTPLHTLQPHYSRTTTAFAYLAIFLWVFFCHFTRLHEFGLWEDDYWSIAPNLDRPVGSLWSLFVSYMSSWPTGRPLNHFLPVALASVGAKCGGLTGVYVLAMVWLTLNVSLVFAILRRLLGASPALVGAVAYVVYPADTTRILLVHAAHVQGAMTFMLCGTLLWIRGGKSRWASYLVAIGSLLAYETAFLPFLAVPLLSSGDRRTTLRKWAVHLGTCFSFIALIAFIRFRTGDVRAAAAVGSMGETVFRVFSSMYLGPFTGIRSLFNGVQKGWQFASSLALVCGGSLVVAQLVWIRVRRNESVWAGQSSAASAKSAEVWPKWLTPADTEPGVLPWWWFAIAGLLVWSGSYALTIVNYPPTQLVGRFTSTHMAAAWPMALIAAAGASGLQKISVQLQRLAVCLALVVSVLLVNYHHYIQDEYIKAWQAEKTFWREVLDLCPDAKAGWTIIVTGQVNQPTDVIAANSWADYHVARQIFSTKISADETKFGHYGYLGALLKFQRTDAGVTWQPQFWGGPVVTIDPSRLALLASDGVSLRRVTEIETEAGKLSSTAAVPPKGRVEWPKTPVARLLFSEQAH